MSVGNRDGLLVKSTQLVAYADDMDIIARRTPRAKEVYSHFELTVGLSRSEGQRTENQIQ